MKKSKASKPTRDKASAALGKQFMISTVKVIAMKIIEIKKKNGGRVPYGELAKQLKEGKKIYPQISRRTVNNYVVKLEKENIPVKSKLLTMIKQGDGASGVSYITKLTDDSNLNNTINASTASNNNNSSIKILGDPTDTPSNHIQNIRGPSTVSSSTNENGNTTAAKGGRPKGTTSAYSLELKNNIEEATKESVRQLADMQSQAHVSGRKRKGHLPSLSMKLSNSLMFQMMWLFFHQLSGKG